MGAEAAIPIIGGALAGAQGATNAANATNAAINARQRALQGYLDIHVPDPEAQRIILDRYKSTGQLDPQMEQAVQQSATELLKVQPDPASRAAEIAALNKMSTVANSNGMDAQAQQMEAEAIQKSNANAAGQRGAIIQNAAARGTGGSGASLAAQLEASQADANTASAGGMSAAAAAEQRALQAMTSSSQMASNLNSQDYTQAANKAAAADAINRFNTQNTQAVNNANVTATNAAAEKNLNNSQNLANSNVDIGNKQEVANKGLVQQQFSNQMSLAAGRANAENGVAAGQDAQASNIANQWANIGSAISQGSAAVLKNRDNSSAPTTAAPATSTNYSSGAAPIDTFEASSDNPDDYDESKA